MTLPACFVCGCEWVCSHREPELLMHYARVLATIARHRRELDPEVPDKPQQRPTAPVIAFERKAK
jgi:hypothetical protein